MLRIIDELICVDSGKILICRHYNATGYGNCNLAILSSPALFLKDFVPL